MKRNFQTLFPNYRKTMSPLLASIAFVFASALAAGSLSSCVSRGANGAFTGEQVELRVHNDEMVNDPKLADTPSVIFISIDGYRYDYNAIFNPPNLTKIEREGVAARSLQPAYPSKTLPNHFTLVTGLYTDRHGIVANEFRDPARNNLVFDPGVREIVEDPTWYSGDPLWNVIQRAGLRTAAFMYFGSEAKVGGDQPNFYFKYSDYVTNAARVDQILDWMRMSEERRPRAIFAYFLSIDKAGHEYGTKSTELRQAILDLDEQIGRLRAGLEEIGKPVNLIVVSDHGMTDVDPKKTIILDESPEIAAMFGKFLTSGRGPQMQLYLKPGENKSVIVSLEKALEKQAREKKQPFRVLRGRELARLNYDSTPKVGDLVIEPDLPWLVGLKAKPPGTKGGNHGWDPKYRDMHGIFYATGPSFKSRALLPSFENIHVYPIVLEALSLKVPKGIDGKSDIAREAIVPRKAK